jgi:hypothetical protein
MIRVVKKKNDQSDRVRAFLAEPEECVQIRAIIASSTPMRPVEAGLESAPVDKLIENNDIAGLVRMKP